MKKTITTALFIMLCTVGWGQSGRHIGSGTNCEAPGATCMESNDPTPATLYLPNVTVPQGIRYCDQLPDEEAGEECVQRRKALAKRQEKAVGDVISQYMVIFDQLRSCQQTLNQAIQITKHPKETLKEAEKQ